MRGLTVVFTLLAFVSLGGVAGCVALSSFTAGKLERMRMIRGEVPGATFVVGRVVAVRVLPDSGQCEIEIEADGRPTRQWADAPECTTLTKGSEVTLARTPGEPGLELKNGTFVSDGNVRFDAGLLVVERVGAGVFGLGTLALGIAALVTRRRER